VPVSHDSYSIHGVDIRSVKAWIRRNWAQVQASEHPELALLEAAHTVTPDKARAWFTHSGYNM
jgi:hypothetical protein